MTVKKSRSSAESDEEFLKRIMKLKESAERKSSSDIASYSEEGNLREKGKEMAKKLEEYEECKKIVEEFKSSPPLFESVHVNGIMFEFSCKNSRDAKKIELLKKNGFPFTRAINYISTYPVNFRTFGRAYLKRGMQKTYLPENSMPPILPGSNIGMGGGRPLDPKNKGIILQDGDILGTEEGYIYEFVDSKQSMDSHNTDVIIFPNSEMRISISRETKHSAPSGMIPEKIPEAVKRASSNTVMTDSIEGIELIRGIFKLNLLRKGRNVNSMIKLPSDYPKVEFEPASKAIMKAIMQQAENAKKTNPKIGEMIMTQMSKAGGARSSVPDDIACFIELGSDGSLVIFGTPNSIVHKGIGKETKMIDMTKKITLTHDAIYETDCSKIKDPRVDLIMKKSMAVTSYISTLASRKEFEENAKRPVDMEADKKMLEDDKVMMKNAEELGDDTLINMMKEKLKVSEGRVKSGATQKEAAALQMQFRKTREYIQKNEDVCKRDVEASLPPYSMPSEKDKV